MLGVVIIIIALLSFPIVVGLSTAGIAALLGFFLQRDGDIRNAGTELVELNN